MRNTLSPALSLFVFLPLMQQRAAAQDALQALAAQAPAEIVVPQAGAPARLPPPAVDTDSSSDIARLGAAEMAAATPEQRLAMLRTLVKDSRPVMNGGETDWRQRDTENALYRLFESA